MTSLSTLVDVSVNVSVDVSVNASVDIYVAFLLSTLLRTGPVLFCRVSGPFPSRIARKNQLKLYIYIVVSAFFP